MNIISTLIGITIGTLSPMLQPVSRGVEYDFNRRMPNQLPQIGDLVDLYWKGQLAEDSYFDFCAALGYDRSIAQIYLLASAQTLAEGDLISAWRRGQITEEEFNQELSWKHYSPLDIERIKRVSEFFPSAPDLIRFAVREVYTARQQDTFGQFQDIPPIYLSESAKAGLPKEQAENYWAAHWELPGIQQGFEMLHRGVISKETLDVLLRALDVMPFWRDKLTAISHNPYTRVDVRRMYALGVLDEDDVFTSYKDLGYDDEKAAKMTEFTIKYESNDDLGLTRSTALNAYKDDLISESQAVNYMKRLGYSDDTIDLYMVMADYEKYQDDIKLYVEELRQQYRAGIITIEQFRTTLNSLDLPSAYINAQVTKEEIQLSNKVKVPSKSDVDKWLDLSIINEKQYAAYLRRQGYQDIDIAFYLQQYALTKDTRERKFLRIETYQRWLQDKIISVNVFTSIAEDMGYSEQDIQNLIREVSKDNGNNN